MAARNNDLRRQQHPSPQHPPQQQQPPAAARVVRVGAYPRVSREEQLQGYSISEQRDAITQEAAAWARDSRDSNAAWDITWYTEEGKSARGEKLAKRVQFQRMLTDARAGRLDLIVVHKLDRFSRNLRVQLEAIGDLSGAGVGILSIVERPDLTTPQGKLLANMLGSVAQYFTDNLSEEVKKGIRGRAKRGLQMNRVPFGYRRLREDEPLPEGVQALGKAPPVPDDGPDGGGAWAGYQELKRLTLLGHTAQEVADRLNAAGRWRVDNAAYAVPDRAASADPWLGRFTRQNVATIRANVFYRPWRPGETHGTVVSAGIEYPGAHVAACTWDEWQTMQGIATGGRRRGAYRTAPEAGESAAEFRGLVVCATCGGRAYVTRFYSKRRKDGTRTTYEQYRCEAVQRGVTCPDQGHFARVEDVRAAWLDWLAQVEQLFPAQWEAMIRRYVTASERERGHGGGSGSGAGDGTGRDLERERRAWQERRRRVIESYHDLLIDRAERNQRVQEAEREIARLDAALAASRGGAAHHADALIFAGRQVVALATLWSRMTADERGRMAALLIEPHGLPVRLLGYHHASYAPAPPVASCELVTTAVRLHPAVRDALDTLRQAQVDVRAG
ncbi:MAG: recombinase family protein [Ktedonobacterales bacterium]|nr:recombinase family protein [Ktedonobacterales bacterium]